MNKSRDRILYKIRNNIKTSDNNIKNKSKLLKSLESPKSNLLPKRAKLKKEEILDVFIRNAKNVSSTVSIIYDLSDVPKEIGEYLSSNNIASRIIALPDNDLDNIDWKKLPTLEVEKKFVGENDETVITSSYMAIAETGTVIQLSGSKNPITSHFLPDNCIVLLRASRITSAIEGVFSRLRKEYKNIPRTLAMISGPSRTGDIALKMEMGAHGPRKVHLLILDDRKL